ncbi:MAG TPA: hypothetical protein PKH01_06940 [Pseudomonadales bacterium]|nr:hypothetical protein [Pseudomonadales bacterium]
MGAPFLARTHTAKTNRRLYRVCAAALCGGRSADVFARSRTQRADFREVVLMHAVARLVLSPYIHNIQASWVKLGNEGVVACLAAGVNDLGGTLMNESITRAAGATHGQENSPENLDAMITAAQRAPQHRSTLYSAVDVAHIQRSYSADELLPLVNDLVTRVKVAHH